MIESWWKAHELEFVAMAIVVGLIAVVWFIESLVVMREERKRKRRDGLL